MIVVAARISFFQFAKKENYKKIKKEKGNHIDIYKRVIVNRKTIKDIRIILFKV